MGSLSAHMSEQVDYLRVDLRKADARIAELEAERAGMVELPRELQDALAEQRRQIHGEGWTPDHDDQHIDGELARAAACYALPDAERSDHTITGDSAPIFWPWAEASWKPKDRRYDLVRAAALIIAEIGRLDRVKSRGIGS